MSHDHDGPQIMESTLALCGSRVYWRRRHVCVPRTLRTLLFWDSRVMHETCTICGLTLHPHDDWYEDDDAYTYKPATSGLTTYYPTQWDQAGVSTDHGYLCYNCWINKRSEP